MSTTANHDDLELHLTRIFDAPRDLVFAACTQKVHMDAWMCPHGFTRLESSGDKHVGEPWSFIMRSPDGERCASGGTCQKIVPNELLVFTHAWEGDDGQPGHGTTVTMRFEDAGGGRTRLRLDHVIFRSVAARDLHRGGWTESLDKLGEKLSAAPAEKQA